ncbi:MAG: DUF1302 domain-containing protein [Pseudomonadota bacterium]|nr:DUF1302 domain-containing protein [Pseudomonadota bacterium]
MNRYGLTGLALCTCLDAIAADVTVSGRVTFGSVTRLENADPALLTVINAPLVGLAGTASGANADDADLNFKRHDAVSTAVKGLLALHLHDGSTVALVRLKAWRDIALEHGNRPWGNANNGYVGGMPLGDSGAARLSRFSGVALGDAWVQDSIDIGSARLLGRIGQQLVPWGGPGSAGSGLEALNARDAPAARRAGAVAQETRVPAPMLFARLALQPTLALEGFVGGRFTPAALDMCGTFWAVSDYLANGCDVVMAGLPAQDDRTRVRTGAVLRRLPTPAPRGRDIGLALQWTAMGTDFGVYQARTTWRSPLPGLRRSSRIGRAIVPGNPDGKNMAFMTEYPERIGLTAATFTRRVAGTTTFGELSWRPRTPFMLSPGDVLPPFMNPTVPALLRAAADVVPPGGFFHGYDFHPVVQWQLGVQHDGRIGATPVSASAEVVAKHVIGLPDQALRRYGRADLFGVGPVFGVCTVTTADAARQCTQNGYVTSNAVSYRLRVEARWPALAPRTAVVASAAWVHDVKGWSGDFLINQGRKSLNLGLRVEYRQRYLLELTYLPIWGGAYNPFTDRDTLAYAVGVKF